MRMMACALGATWLCVVLCACGGGNGSGDDSADSQADSSSARLVGGVEGAKFASSTAGLNGTASTPSTTSGTTDVAGKFALALYQTGGCLNLGSSDSLGCTTSSSTTIYGSTIFSIGGQSLPSLPGPSQVQAGQTPAYTAWDFFGDQQSVENLGSVLLMANVNTGEPTQTGIKISDKLQNGSCPNFNWATTSIQEDAACMQTTAQQDGQAHPWPSAQAVSDYLSKTYLCSHSGLYLGAQYNIATPGYAASTVGGNFSAIVDMAGQVQGALDFSRLPNTAPYFGIIQFAGSVVIAPGGVGTVNYTAPTTAPLPNMTISMSLLPYAATGTWQTADGSLAGSTASTTSGVTNPGLGLLSHIAYPKYRFLKSNVSYTLPGTTAPANFVMTMDVGYNGQANGSLNPWPYSAATQIAQGFFTWHGTMTGNTVNLTWDANKGDTVTATTKVSTLTLDPTSNGLAGTFIGKDGGTFMTFTTGTGSWGGCRM